MKLIKIPNAKVIAYELPKNNYYQQKVKKTQIVLHHTAGNPHNPQSTIDWWKMRLEGQGTVATAFVIGYDGTIVQAFEKEYWAYHIGAKQCTIPGGSIGKIGIEQQSIGIEIASWGALSESKMKTLNKDEVVFYENGYRGNYYYHKYSPYQIAALCELVHTLANVHHIPLKYSYNQIFGINEDALNGQPGMYSHVSFRADKSDIHPQTELIEGVFKNL